MTLRRAFQFLLVRLLVKEASNIHDIIGFQFLLVRLLADKLDHVPSNKVFQFLLVRLLVPIRTIPNSTVDSFNSFWFDY